MKKIGFIVFVFAFLSVEAQEKTRMAFINAHAHLGNGQEIETSVVTVRDGLFEMVSDMRGLRLDFKAYDTVIDLQGKHIYPALINTDNVLGLHDAEAVRATQDFYETGQLNPHVRALIAYNTDNLIIPTVRSNGVLYTQVCPRGGLISGSSSVLQLHGWNWEDAVVRADDGIHMTFPRSIYRRQGQDEESYRQAEKKYLSDLNQLNSFFVDAISYLAVPASKNKDLRYEAMGPVMAGAAKLYIHADKTKDILNLIRFKQRFNIPKVVLVGGRESYKLTAELKQEKIPVMLNRVHDLPAQEDDHVDSMYELPYLLQKDSVLFCLQLEGDMEAMHSRNLSFNAGTAVAYGLTKEQALMAISLNAAIILGLEKKIGSLEAGKIASFIVSDGDILDMKTHQVILAYLGGRKLDLENQQSALYKKYKNKYGIK